MQLDLLLDLSWKRQIGGREIVMVLQLLRQKLQQIGLGDILEVELFGFGDGLNVWSEGKGIFGGFQGFWFEKLGGWLVLFRGLGDLQGSRVYGMVLKDVEEFVGFFGRLGRYLRQKGWVGEWVWGMLVEVEVEVIYDLVIFQKQLNFEGQRQLEVVMG